MTEGMSVAEAIRAAAARLAAVSDTARLDAELLMAHALAMTRSDMLLRAMHNPAPARFAPLLERRMTHEPVAYITGETEFYGLGLRVNAYTLIPRADSETLIDAALEVAGDEGRAIDLGTGSGALLLAFMASRPAWQGVGIDASGEALSTARTNARDLGLAERTVFHCRDWSRTGWADTLGTFDLILCNPPYVEDDAELDPQVRNFEPASALFAGPEGLDDYRTLIPQLPALMNTGAQAIIEIGASQADAVAALAQAAGLRCELRRDLAGRARALILRA